MLRLALIFSAILIGAQAGAVCQWTVQRTEDFFVQKLDYTQKPKIESAACKPGVAPLCSGYVYCPIPGQPPKGIASACKSVQVAGKWRCPTAEICYNDHSVTISELAQAPVSAAPAELPAAPAATTE